MEPPIMKYRERTSHARGLYAMKNSLYIERAKKKIKQGLTMKILEIEVTTTIYYTICNIFVSYIILKSYLQK